MAIIKSIKRKTPKSRRVVVEFENDRTPIELNEEAAMVARLRKGDDLPIARIEELLAEDERIRCKEAAWRLLGRKLRSRAELNRDLRTRKFPQQVIDGVIEALVAAGHLNDADFAKQFVEHRTSQRRSGPNLVRQELRARGVNRDLVDTSVEPMSEDQQETARRLLEKWNRRKEPSDPRKRQQSAAAFLMRRGFDSELVWELVREMVGGK